VVKWKPFDGSLPRNAFLAGETSSKQKIYIGRGKLQLYRFPRQTDYIPGRYIPEEKVLVVSADQQTWKLTTDFEILTTDHSDRLKWMKPEEYNPKRPSQQNCWRNNEMLVSKNEKGPKVRPVLAGYDKV